MTIIDDNGIHRPLGDGVVASFDGFDISLSCGGLTIMLSQEQLANFLEFVADLKREFAID